MRVKLENLIGGAETDAAWQAMPEADRIASVQGFGAVPEACGPAIIPAVARGPVRAVRLQIAYLDGRGELETMPAGFKGRATMVVADVFDRMQAQAARKGSRIPLTVAQIEMARLYARTVERHEAGAVRCSSVETIAAGNGGRGDGFTDARLASSRRIDLWRNRIGTGMAMEVKRVRKARPGDRPRVTITARDLVDLVCIADMEPAKVLRKFGWQDDGKSIRALTEALGAILDRMAGPVRRGAIVCIRPDLPPNIWNRQ